MRDSQWLLPRLPAPRRSPALRSAANFAAENDALKDRISAETMATLRAEIVALEHTLAAVTASRDQLMRENAELKKQCQIQQRELKKLRG